MEDRQYVNVATDYFVYNAGDPSRPPSLSLLPPCYMSDETGFQIHGRRSQLNMDRETTGILRRGDREFVLAAIRFIQVVDDGGAGVVVADLRVLRSRDLHWKIKRLRVHHDVNNGEVTSYCCWDYWGTDRVIPVGDRFFYWVDLYKGIVFSDMSQETPELRFLPLPVEPVDRRREDWDRPESSRSVCSTDGGATVKFVHVSPRCCCGGPGATQCALSRHAFTVTTWTLRRTKGRDMGWEKDAVVDCSDLWGLDAYRLLPRPPMDFPVVSIDDPDVVCFLVSEHKHLHHDGDKTTWVAMVDTRRKTLLRTTILSKDKHYQGNAFLPSQVSSYLNTSPGSNNRKLPASESRCANDTVDVPPAAKSVWLLLIRTS
ncbi:uncharacterized protein [Aegilops tauschii subsp. strangulata]|uniref:uncharacterized protein n=1 Tax=Aegilops tauschii subsp. strangulata TaxID=200361 RepID=UPI00084588F6|nr:uncharacterized protein LOC123493593 [Aegilops tauschii subsp. strangulata]